MTRDLHYIASGCSYLRFNAPRNVDVDQNREYINQSMEKLTNSSKRHEFGLLFNAFTESTFGEKFAKFDGHKHTHSDSGGLQLITQGKKVNDQIKDEIYATQADWSDLGMCFDEIPIGMTGATSGRNDVNNRWFKADEMEHFARLTGKNIARQIQVYHERDSKCRPILIAQGNGYDSYLKWVEYVLDEIPQSEHKYIGGVAMGAAALGTGTLEDFERAFIFSQIPLDVKHLHILGVGSVKRLYPYLAFHASGLYKDITLSYDSTSHTSGGELANYYTKTFDRLSFNRQYSKKYELMYNEIKDFIDLSGLDARDFFTIMNSSYTKHIEENKGSDFDFLRVRTGIVFRMIHNFINHVETVSESKEAMINDAIKHNLHNQVRFLYDIKNKSDWDRWCTNFQRTVRSNRVASEQPLQLEF